MFKHIFYALVCVPLGLLGAKGAASATPEAKNAYNFHFISITGEEIPLSQFKGKVVLVVNTASECGFTPQYEELQTLWRRYGGQGLVVIAVPSNDFGGQEPGSAAQIKEFCQVEYGVDFILTEKNIVTGEQAHPFYRWARATLGVLAAPKWNFHKYLIAPDGTLDSWYASPTKPLSPKITTRIEELLRKTPQEKPAS